MTRSQRNMPAAGQLHGCPAVADGLARQLADRVRAEPWLLRALDTVAASGLPDAWIGAGVLRDVVWGQLHGGFDPATVRDIDVAFFDPGDLSDERDRVAQRALARLADLPWEATNQAAVHTWFHGYFGGAPIPAFGCVHDAVATWPETAVCVAIRRVPCGTEVGARGDFEICAPHGLTDLLDMTWRPNLRQVTAEISAARFDRQRGRFPAMTVAPSHEPDPTPPG